MQTTNHYYVEDLGPLYEAVQGGKLFKDSKYFVDAVPKKEVATIVADYARLSVLPAFDLAKFVEENFILPPDFISDYVSGDKPIREHLDGLWDVLKRTPSVAGGTLVPLPFPYIVPGGRFREIYYWDSYFTMLGLQVSKRVDIIQHMVDNFAYLVDQVGFIPNGNRTYYLGRSQPPFFSLMVEILAEEKGEQVLLQYRAQLEKEYQFWMDGDTVITEKEKTKRRVVRMPDASVLNRYWDDRDWVRPEAFHEDGTVCHNSGRPIDVVARHLRAACESGWDFSSRWFRDSQKMTSIETCDIIPIDLNCLLLHLEENLLKIAVDTNDRANADRYLTAINSRKKALDKYCWNETEGCFFDYHHVDGQQTGKITAAAAFPLFFKLASKHQAAKTESVLVNHLLQEGGLVTTTLRTGQQWDSPNGWAPLQWIAFQGLLNYELNGSAETLRKSWTATCEKVYAATGKMMEKYNVVDTETNAGGGEYLNQDGFGWTNGVYLKMASMSAAASNLTS